MPESDADFLARVRRELLARGFIAGEFYSVADLQDVRPDLSRAQCLEVLADCDENREAVRGPVNEWTLFLRARALYPEGE
jgi:hypothetical protein